VTGPMHGINASITSRPNDCVVKMKSARPICSIIDIGNDPAFFALEWNASRIFVSASSEIPDLNQNLHSHWFDVKDHFLSAVPILMYLKWAFRNVCWQATEPNACLIIDDPVLKAKYGFCDFRELDSWMQQHSFATNIAFIPWNWRRTSVDIAR